MSVLSPLPLSPLVSYRSRWSIPVPWDKADDLRYRLRRRGLQTTVCLDPDTREARLEPWPGVAIPAFMAALGECMGMGRKAATA